MVFTIEHWIPSGLYYIGFCVDLPIMVYPSFIKNIHQYMNTLALPRCVSPFPTLVFP